MTHKVARTSALIAVLLVLLFTLSNMQFSVVNANPTAYLPPSYFPKAPLKTSPVININSPNQNRTQSGSVTLNFTLAKPASWFGSMQFPLENRTTYFSAVKLRSYYFVLDDEKSNDFSIDDSGLEEEFPSKNLSFYTAFEVNDGNHSLTVYVNCQSYYDPYDS